MACADRWKYDPHVSILKARYQTGHGRIQREIHLKETALSENKISESVYNRTTIIQEIEGVESTISTGPGELYIDIPATSPRYIHVQEGDCIMEGTSEVGGERS